MRVVAGRWRGRRLRAPAGDATRPTTDRVKEAVFSILGEEIAGARIADLCCGSGGLGIEALSRGAATVVFVDHSWQALEAVKHNLKTCGAEAGSYALHRGDALRWLRSRATGRDVPDMILADPPYGGDLPAALWAACVERAAAGDVRRVVLEHAPELETASPPPGWRVDRRRYGATALSIMEICDD